MRIIIGGDLVPTKSNINEFLNGEYESIVDKGIRVLLTDADFRCFNLEVPLTNYSTPIKKNGPNLAAKVDTIKTIKKINPDLFTLANNHILDQGEQGLVSTIETLEKFGINFIGAGKNTEEAQKTFVFEKNGIKVGFFSCVEHEFSVCSDVSYGANPFDSYKSTSIVEELKKECSFVIVLYHGGIEHYRYPSPELQKTCRALVDSGADLVLCQHSHCVGCEEKWKSGTIIYGQGNFLFDYSKNECWDTGLLIELVINKSVEIIYHPVIRQQNGVKLAIFEGKEILNSFYERSKRIQQDGFLEKEYIELAERNYKNYIGTLLSNTTSRLWYRILDKATGRKFSKWYLSRAFSEKSKLALLNYLECESHRELLIKGLKGKIDD